MGRERGGLSPSLATLCDTTVRIPMVGQCDSLNLAISTGVMLYGIYGRHHPTPAPP
jgi:TrmH family RNA methyltransferase